MTFVNIFLTFYLEVEITLNVKIRKHTKKYFAGTYMCMFRFQTARVAILNILT